MGNCKLNQKQLNKAFELCKTYKLYHAIPYSFHLTDMYLNHLLSGGYMEFILIF